MKPYKYPRNLVTRLKKQRERVTLIFQTNFEFCFFAACDHFPFAASVDSVKFLSLLLVLTVLGYLKMKVNLFLHRKGPAGMRRFLSWSSSVR